MQGRSHLLAKIFAKIPRSYLKPIVHGLIISSARYKAGIVGRGLILHSDPSNKLMTGIQTVLNDTMRSLAGKKKKDEIKITELRKETGIPSLNQIVIEDSLMLTWASRRYNLPLTSARTFFHAPSRPTRFSGKGLAIIPRLKRGLAQDDLQSRLARAWNETPQSFQDETNDLKARKMATEFALRCPSTS